MTTRHIALLRGINVGGHNKISMQQQHELAEGLGYADVKVYLHTGNILFSAPDDLTPARIAADIERRLNASIGADIAVTMRTRDELAAEIEANPYPEAVAVPKSLHCIFLSAAPQDTAKLDALDLAAFAPDSFRLLGRIIYLHCPDGIGRSKLAAKLTSARLAGVTATARNWNTATKLLQLADD
jgi:uncharacterized protein (DUF1697 family)